jgi:ADP-heptose:LPS heptosyltransferase
MRAWDALLGRRRRVDTIIYKADRLGDWVLAEPAIERIVASVRARGGDVVIWAATESDAARRWRGPGCAVESFALEPVGLRSKGRRAFRVARLLAAYDAQRLVCLRHTQEPVRDFVLSRIDAPEVHALSSVSRPGAAPDVPHEVARHFSILSGLGLAPGSPAELLPRISGAAPGGTARAVLAPYSSMPMKDWTDEAWAEVGAYLTSRGLRVEIWVGPGQLGPAEALAGIIADRANGAPVTVRTGAVADLALAVSSAALVVSVDTFAAHLAAAYDAPMVALLGGGHYGDFAPWRRSARQQWVSHPLPCFNCGWHCTRPRTECLLDISHLAVMSKIESVLHPDGAEPPRAPQGGA